MQVKGVALRTTLLSIELELGKDALDRVMRAVPPDTREALAPGVLAASSYDIRHQAALHEAVREQLGAGTFTANRRVGARAAKIDFGGVYRVFVIAATYERLVRTADRAFRQYNSQGAVVWKRIERGHADGEVVGVDGWTEAMWHALAGRLETLLVLGGAKHATVRVEAPTSTGCHMHAEWA